ncbi:DUF3099 domain-containing protein [Schumannella sp. 10F1B-5-1]|uniref:DUF3099 domain-containing protein n=1 Tax=Schumannella sp. 10F1B-5-1 TaxID=2590780 RepID=UPI0011328E73|nr:DUF3099 domain-containing protein [Schumannella sp. 10F1B-5-1]TPW70958.1 DUF3099 domain-containing protein [Schumannella sp. 10F1B-5-1]
MRTEHATVTELPLSPEQERRSRMIKYVVAMSIRVVCIILCVVVKGWWLVLPIAGAVFLPYFAVVVANAGGSHAPRRRVLRPGAIVRSSRRDDAA